MRPPMLSRSDPPLAFAVTAALFAACFLGGGSARPDVQSLIYLRPVAVVCLALALLLALYRGERIVLRPPLVLLGGLALLMLLQLVPMPPSWWAALPGHAIFADPTIVAEVGTPWRPLTLSPDRTINALLTLIFPAAVLLLYPLVEPQWRLRLVPMMIVLATLSAALGILQFASGGTTSAYLYAITHRDLPVGLFANRNHHAAFLAATLPMLRFWTLMPVARAEHARVRAVVAGGLGLLLTGVIIATGSRAGIGVALVGLLGTLWVAPLRRPRAASRRTIAGVLAGAVAVAAVAVGMIALGRGLAFDRLFGGSILDDARAHSLPAVLALVPKYLPLGAGFGTFEDIFRIDEPAALLAPSYLNHAHNDFVELVLDGGVPAALLGIAFLVWMVRRCWPLVRKTGAAAHDLDRALARLGAVVLLILLIASVPDYPLRTPMLAGVFALACCWLDRQRRDQRQSGG